MRWFVFLPLALFTLLLVGCFSKSKSATSVVEGIVVEIWVSNDNPQPGEQVRIHLTLTNETTHVHVVELVNRPVVDIVIDYRVLNESIVVRWSDGKTLTSGLTRLELKPGESKSIEMNWVVDRRAFGETVGISGYFIYSASLTDYPVHPAIVIPVGPYNK